MGRSLSFEKEKVNAGMLATHPWVETMWKRIFNPSSTRWCSRCRTSPVTLGGEYRLYNDGKNQKWICKDCLRKQNDKT